MIPAVAFAVLAGLLVIFQFALALGAPWGRLAWGGQHSGRLPVGYRIASGISVLLYAFLVTVLLDRAAVIVLYPDGFSQVAAWVVFGFLALGVLLNLVSRSKPERFVMTPVALVLAVLAFLVAWLGPGVRTFEGMVWDDGSGAVFCTTVLESYPPQCPPDSPPIVWDWSEQMPFEEQGIRWGNYRFEGVQDRNGIRVISVPENVR